MPFTAYFAAQSKMAEDPELFAGFTRAICRGQQWVLTHTPEEVAAVLEPYFADTDMEVPRSGGGKLPRPSTPGLTPR